MPSDITLTVFVNETVGLRPVWETRGYMNNSWIPERVDYNASGPHQVSFYFKVTYPDKYCFEQTSAHF